MSCNAYQHVDVEFIYDVEELVGKKINILIPSPYKEQHDTYLKRYLTTGIPRVIGKTRIVEAQHKSGTVFTARISVSAVQACGQQYFVGTIDQLESKQAIITATLDGKIISCNQNCEDVFGWKVSEMVNRNLTLIMPPPHCHKHDEYMAAYRRTGVSRVIGRVRNVSALHRDGTVFPISLRVQHIRTGLVDVLRATIERVDSDLEAVFTIDEAGIIESANRNFVLTLFGYTTEELIGKPIGFLVPSLLPRIEEKEKQKQEQRQQQQHHQQQQQQQQEPSAEQQQDTPEQQQRSGQKDEDTDEWRLRVSAQMEVQHKDGSRFPVHLEVMRFLNEYGQVRYSGRIRRVTTSSEDNATATSSGSDNSAIGSTTSPAASSTPSQELVGEYVLGRVLGRGSYGLVRHATHRSSGRQVAIKLLCKEQLDPRQLEYARREASLLQRLGPHPGLVRLYEVIETPTRLCLVLEYLEGGELQALISRRGALPEDEARRLFEQIARAIHFCHRQGVVHRDVKAKNVLLDAHGTAKLIDFGLANFMAPEGQYRSTFCGTLAYAAPEMILAKKYLGPEVDIWSLGVLLFAMVAGRFPFASVADVIEGKYTLPESASADCADLIRRLLQVDPRSRYTIEQVLAHQWLRGASAPSLAQDSQPSLSSSSGPTGSSAPLLRTLPSSSSAVSPLTRSSRKRQAPADLESESNGHGCPFHS